MSRPPGMRLDGPVFRYAGNTVLIMLACWLPALVFLVGMVFMPAAGAILGLPLIMLAGGAVTRASIKLPAVALGNAGFSFRDAWKASEGNFWACVGVFLLNAAILLGILLVLTLVVEPAGARSARPCRSPSTWRQWPCCSCSIRSSTPRSSPPSTASSSSGATSDGRSLLD